MFVIECARVALFLSSLVLATTVADHGKPTLLSNQRTQYGDSLSLKKRGISDEDLILNFSISLSSLPKELVGVCYGGNTTGLGDTSLTLQYRVEVSQDVEWSKKKSGIPLLPDILLFSIDANRASVEAGRCVEFRLIQKEHGGGSCNCWAAENITGLSTSAGMQISFDNVFYMCNTTASQHRVLTCAYCSDGSANATLSCSNMTEDMQTQNKPFILNSCSGKPHLNVSFQLIASTEDSCNTITNFNEGVEFSIQLGGSEAWIPLAVLFHEFGMDNGIVLGNVSNLIIRNFPVNQEMLIELTEAKHFVDVSLELCDFKEMPEFVQFRWLQTSRFSGSKEYKDIWGIDNVNVSYVPESGNVISLLYDSFEKSQLK